jgi:diamine N-acetyltransferase
MASWNVEPQPPEVIGPWFLWNCILTSGIRAAVMAAKSSGTSQSVGAELLTSYVPRAGGPARFYERLGFVPTGDRDANDEIIVGFALP